MDEEFTHGGGEGEFRRFAMGEQALVEGFADGVVAGGDQGSHVEGLAHGLTTAADVALAAEQAAVVIEGSEASESGGLVLGEAAEFWQGSQEGGGRDGAHAFDGSQSRELGTQARTGTDQASEGGFNAGDLAVEEVNDGAMGVGHSGIGAPRAVFFCRAHFDELGAPGSSAGGVKSSPYWRKRRASILSVLARRP